MHWKALNLISPQIKKIRLKPTKLKRWLHLERPHLFKEVGMCVSSTFTSTRKTNTKQHTYRIMRQKTKKTHYKRNSAFSAVSAFETNTKKDFYLLIFISTFYVRIRIVYIDINSCTYILNVISIRFDNHKTGKDKKKEEIYLWANKNK